MFVISTRNFPPDVGGIQNLMEGLSNVLVNHGPVKVFADSFKDSETYDKNSKLSIERVSGFKFLKKYRKSNLVNEFVKKNNVRALFFDHWKSIENINNQTLANTITFCLIHSKEINHPIGSNLNNRMNKAFKKANYIIANSNFTKDLSIKLGLNEKNIKVINPGCNHPIKFSNFFKKKAEDLYKDSYPKIITIARLDKRKNHEKILMTIKNLKAKFPKIKYISIGEGDERSNLEKLKIELGLENEIILLNNVEEEFKAALLSNSNLFLMPSIIHNKSVEGFGISFLEAASYKVASIGGNCGGERDSILDGKTGYICDGNDLNSIYGSVLKFFENDNCNVLGSSAFEFSRNFSWNKIIKKYLDLI